MCVWGGGGVEGNRHVPCTVGMLFLLCPPLGGSFIGSFDVHLISYGYFCLGSRLHTHFFSFM